jgi:hypothetical protein
VRDGEEGRVLFMGGLRRFSGGKNLPGDPAAAQQGAGARRPSSGEVTARVEAK